MYLLDKIKDFREQFSYSDHWHLMEKCVEGSQWHREENVAVHTDMVVDYFLNNYYDENYPKYSTLIFLATLFHDTGKPIAKLNPNNRKVNDEGVTYFRFTGHELLSARIFEQYALNSSLMQNFDLTEEDVFSITWLIENHLPFGVKKSNKVQSILGTVDKIFNGQREWFTWMLTSDCYGRISDNHDAKKKDMHDWCVETVLSNPWKFEPNLDAEKELTVLIGPSGSGKSTFTSQYPDATVYSWDKIRIAIAKDHEVWDDNLSDAWNYNNAYQYIRDTVDGDAEFKSRIQNELNEALRSSDHVIIDNVNLSRKRRNQFVTAARAKGFKVTGVYFQVTEEVLKKHHDARTDHKIGFGIVKDMHQRVQVPNYVEFDEIKIITKK